MKAAMAQEALVASEIRKRKLMVRSLRRKEADPDEILLVQSEMEELLEKYSTIADGRVYSESLQDIANDFCDEFYYELMKDGRNEITIGKFYDMDASLTVVGNEKYSGKAIIIKSILDKFESLHVEQNIERITIDASLCKGGNIHFDCVSRIKLNDDKPRKILQMFDLVKSTLPSTYPYVAKREYFVVQDARPLYHWPEKPIVQTKHDNWEPQFKPKEVVRPRSATAVAVSVKVEEVAAPAEEDEEEDGDSDGEGGEEGSLEPKSIEDAAATANDGDAKGGGDVEGGAEGYGNVEGEGVEYEGELGEGGQEYEEGYEEGQYDNVEDDQYAELEPGQQEVVIEQ